MARKRYVLRAMLTITEIHDEESPVPGVDNMQNAAALVTRVMSGAPMVAPLMMQANQYEMQKAVEISGAGFATVAEVMKRLDETLDSIALETV